jgi:hypothetical protein
MFADKMQPRHLVFPVQFSTFVAVPEMGWGMGVEFSSMEELPEQALGQMVAASPFRGRIVRLLVRVRAVMSSSSLALLWVRARPVLSRSTTVQL